MKLISLSCFVAASLAAGAAFAQAPPKDPVQTVLPNVLSTADGGTLDMRADYTNIDTNGLGDEPTIFGLNAHFQYVTPGGLGGYVSLPFGYLSQGDESFSGLGNLELGGLYVIRNPELDFFLRGGLAIDTASDEGILSAPLSALLPRPTDAFSTGLASTWLRAHGGLRSTRGAVAFGAEGGVDLIVDGDGDDGDNGLLVLAGSIGIVQPGFSISGGLSFVQLLGDDQGDDNFLAFNGVFDFAVSPKAKLFVALGVNLEDEFDGFSIGGGVRLGL